MDLENSSSLERGAIAILHDMKRLKQSPGTPDRTGMAFLVEVRTVICDFCDWIKEIPKRMALSGFDIAIQVTMVMEAELL